MFEVAAVQASALSAVTDGSGNTTVTFHDGSTLTFDARTEAAEEIVDRPGNIISSHAAAASGIHGQNRSVALRGILYYEDEQTSDRRALSPPSDDPALQLRGRH